MVAVFAAFAKAVPESPISILYLPLAQVKVLPPHLRGSSTQQPVHDAADKTELVHFKPVNELLCLLPALQSIATAPATKPNIKIVFMLL